MKYAFIEERARQFAVASMCRVLRVSRSGYYDWRGRAPGARHRDNERLLHEIRRVHLQCRKTYGARKTWAELQRQGIAGGKHRVARLRAENGIEAERKRRFRRTVRHRHRPEAAPNLLGRQFEVGAPNRIWVGDMTCITTAAGWLHLAVLVDLFARRVVGWAMSSRADEHLPLAALEMAIARRRPAAGLIHHTDQGSQYISRAYRARLSAQAMVSSNSGKGACYDNAVAESFFSNLKNELTHHVVFISRKQAEAAIFEYIEVFYNRRRIHQTLGYRTPEELEMGALPNRP